jgi:hypothetical protein
LTGADLVCCSSSASFLESASSTSAAIFRRRAHSQLRRPSFALLQGDQEGQFDSHLGFHVFLDLGFSLALQSSRYCLPTDRLDDSIRSLVPHVAQNGPLRLGDDRLRRGRGRFGRVGVPEDRDLADGFRESCEVEFGCRFGFYEISKGRYVSVLASACQERKGRFKQTDR